MVETSHGVYLRHFLAAKPVHSLDLSIRAKNALQRARIKNALDIQEHIEAHTLIYIGGIGSATVAEIEDCLGALLESEGFDPSMNHVSLVADSEADSKSMAGTLLDELPIEALTKELGDDLLQHLKQAQIKNFGELAKLARIVTAFIQDKDASIDRLIDHQRRVLWRKIKSGRIDSKVKLNGTQIISWLNQTAERNANRLELASLLTRANEFDSLTEELTALFSDLDERNVEIFVGYFGEGSTLQHLGKEFGVSRERIRQITVAVSTKLWSQANRGPSLYLQSALLFAKDMGDRLSHRAWQQLLEDKDLIERGSLIRGIEPSAALRALLRGSDKAKYPPVFEIDENLAYILNSPSDLSLGVIKAIEEMPSKAKREVRRRISYTGGIHATQASEILQVTERQAVGILRHLGFREAMLDWYTVASDDSVTPSRWPVLKAGLAMMEACGPVEFNLFCDGIRRYISRFYDAIAPPKVIKAHLDVLGFELEEDHVCWAKTPTGYLAESDKCFIGVVERYGRIVTFQEVVEYFQEKGFSIASATSRVLPQSPIVERVDSGLYKLRGQQHTWEDIENAKSRQESIDYDPEVVYGVDGITRFRVTIGTWAVNGVLSVSASQQPIPDLGDGWDALVDDNPCGTVRGDDSLIWGLGSAFNALEVQIGDRIELAFDAWAKPVVRISKI